MTLLQDFMKINKEWPNRSLRVPYENLSIFETFELGYYAASDVPFRCFSIKLDPSNNHIKDVALLYNSQTKQFISLLNNPDSLILTLFESSDESIDKNLELIQGILATSQIQINEKASEIRDQIIKCVLVLRKLDEAMHLALSNELARKVYFSIGECRERAALIPIFQNSKGADLVQLALHKWMDYTLHLPQDQPYPQENTIGLVKNFLQIKKWLRDLITNQLAGINTLMEEPSIS